MANNSLRALQVRFQDYLEGKSDQIEKDILSTDDALSEHRLAAYYNAYRIRLIDCLSTDYKGLQKELGNEAFEYLVLEYLKAHPSQHPSVRWIGQHMATFLKISPHENADFLYELAQFEWYQSLCFDAENSEKKFTLDEMASVPPSLWPQITIHFQSSVRWIDLKWNIPPYWLALDENQKTPPKQHEIIPTRWIMWRKDFSPNWRSLEAPEAWALEAAMKGEEFSRICEGLLEWYGEELVAMTAAGYLKQWIQDEMIMNIIT